MALATLRSIIIGGSVCCLERYLSEGMSLTVERGNNVRSNDVHGL